MASIRQRNVPTNKSATPSLAAQKDVATFTPPTFTIKELLDSIPKECFERSAIKSGAYVVMDFTFIAILGYAAYHINTLLGENGSLLSGNAGIVARWAAWSLYWFYQGLVMTGVWVIAHECGHQSFSESKTINNTVGWVLHSALLVPYHSWRISHARHHAATGHCTRDEVFVPRTASQLGIQTPEGGFDAHAESWAEKADDLLEDSPIYVFLRVIAQQLFGFPMYLIRNASGQKHYPKHTNHFNPESHIFEPRHYKQIIASDIGLALTISAVIYAAKQTSFSTVMAYYGIPYLMVNHWLVLITFLQHTDPNLPHYRNDAWNFQRGALCTQDRNIHNFLTHHIADTHVLHHLKSAIPHYHAQKATEALKAKLGNHYLKSEEHWMVSLWKCYKECRFVDDEGDVVFYRNAKGEQQRRLAEAVDSGVEFNDNE